MPPTASLSSPSGQVVRAQVTFVTDAPDLARAGLSTVGYGPGPWRYQADEFIELDELLDAPRVYLASALLAGG